MGYIKKEELIIGEIYKSNKYNHIFKYQSINGNTNINIGCNYRHFSRDSATIGQGLNNITNATSEEKHWLNEAIRLNKFITFEEAMKTFIPEYVECLMVNTASMHSKYQGIIPILNKIYEVAERSFPEKGVRELAVITKCGVTMYDKYTKPSTKEAYTAQFVVKEPEFVLPEKWCLKITKENLDFCKSLENNELHYPKNYSYYIGGYYSTILSNGCYGFTGIPTNFQEITFDQFKKYILKEEVIVEEVKVIEQPITENKTELEIWLENTKSLNLSLEDLEKYIGSGQTCNFDNIYMKLEGNYSKGRAKILFDKWNEKVIEPLPQFKVIETIETITKVENNEGNQFFIGDVVKSDTNIIHNIKGFKYNVDKTAILAITNKVPTIGVSINKIEHYIEPKVVEPEFILPEKWCITTTLESQNIIFDWLLENTNWKKSGDLTIGNHYCIDKDKCSGWMHFAPDRKIGYMEITFDQFQKYVLKVEVKEETLLEKAKIIEHSHDFKIDDKIKN